MGHVWRLRAAVGIVTLLLPAWGVAWALPVGDFRGEHSFGERQGGLHAFGLKLDGDKDLHRHDKQPDFGWMHQEARIGWLFDKEWDHGKGSGKHVGWADYLKQDPDCDPPVATPEPATIFLLGTALAGLGLVRRRFLRG